MAPQQKKKRRGGKRRSVRKRLQGDVSEGPPRASAPRASSSSAPSTPRAPRAPSAAPRAFRAPVVPSAPIAPRALSAAPRAPRARSTAPRAPRAPSAPGATPAAPRAESAAPRAPRAPSAPRATSAPSAPAPCAPSGRSSGSSISSSSSSWCASSRSAMSGSTSVSGSSTSGSAPHQASPRSVPPPPVPAPRVHGLERGSAGRATREASAVVRAAAPVPGIELRDGFPMVPSASPRAAKPTAADDAAGRWMVEALVIGEGGSGGGAWGMPGVLHASAQGTAPMEAFHPVVWEASIFAGAHEREITLQTYPLPGYRAAGRSGSCPACVVPARRRAVSRQPRDEEVARHVIGFMRQNRGVVVRVSGIGARGAVAWRLYSRRNLPGQPRCTSKTHDCVKSAIINAAFACRGVAAAEALESVLGMESQIFRDFRRLGEIFHRAHESVTRCRVVRNEEVQRAIQSGERVAPFLILAAKRSGVFIVRVMEEKLVDHAVVVDGQKGVIIDSEEQTALELSVGNLARCGGDRAKKLRVVEVREIRGEERVLKRDAAGESESV